MIPPVNWKEIQAADCLCSLNMLQPQGNQFYKVTSFTATERDKPKVQGHIIIKHHARYWISTIKEILVPFESHLASHVTISLFEFLPGLHPHLHAPCLKYSMSEEIVVVPPSVMLDLTTL